ncbi:MAG: hypothetical protein ACJ8C4_01795 [Gemmataceae bacterium]
MAKYRSSIVLWVLFSLTIFVGLGSWDIYGSIPKGEHSPWVRLFRTIRGDDVYVDDTGKVWIASLKDRIETPIIWLTIYLILSIPSGWLCQALVVASRGLKQKNPT